MLKLHGVRNPLMESVDRGTKDSRRVCSSSRSIKTRRNSSCNRRALTGGRGQPTVEEPFLTHGVVNKLMPLQPIISFCFKETRQKGEVNENACTSGDVTYQLGIGIACYVRNSSTPPCNGWSLCVPVHT